MKGVKVEWGSIHLTSIMRKLRGGTSVGNNYFNLLQNSWVGRFRPCLGLLLEGPKVRYGAQKALLGDMWVFGKKSKIAYWSS